MATHSESDPTGLVETHCHADPALWLLENPGFVSGANYRWLRDQFGADEARAAEAGGPNAYARLDTLAEAVPPGAEGLVFLPSLSRSFPPVLAIVLNFGSNLFFQIIGVPRSAL